MIANSQFCHESDLHFRASDRDLVAVVSTAWAAANLEPKAHAGAAE